MGGKKKILSLEEALKKKAAPKKEPEKAKQIAAAQEKRKKKGKDVLRKSKAALAILMPVPKLSPAKLREAKSYMQKYSSKKIGEMKQQFEGESIHELRSKGAINKHGYAKMTSVFGSLSVDKYKHFAIKVQLHGISKFEDKIGAGHIAPENWEEARICDKQGNCKVGYRKIPGVDSEIHGKKIGYYTKGGEYIVVYSGYTITPIKISSPAEAAKQRKREQEFYKKRKAVSKYKPGESLGAYKPELAKKGSVPFFIIPNYRLTSEEMDWYKASRREAKRVSGLNINDRWDRFQERWKLRDAIKLMARAANIRPQHLDYFLAFTDALIKSESSYCNGSMDLHGNRIAPDEHTVGILQIRPSIYRSTKRKWFAKTRYADRFRRKFLPSANIDFSKLAHINFDTPRAEYLSPKHHLIFVLFYIIRYSRNSKYLIPIDEMFENIRTSSGRMRDSWAIAPRLMWCCGPRGASRIIQNMREDIPFPKTKDKAREYYHNNLHNDWVYRRGFNYFWRLVRNCNNYLRRFNKNMRELGG